MSTMTDDRWSEVEPVIRHKAYGRLDNDPHILLEHDGGPTGVKAEVILARLIGFEDEIVHDAVQLSSVLPVYRVPITRNAFRLDEGDTEPSTTLRAAEYVLQSGYAVVPVAAEFAPRWLAVGPPTFTFRVLYLRYRRRK